MHKYTHMYIFKHLEANNVMLMVYTQTYTISIYHKLNRNTHVQQFTARLFGISLHNNKNRLSNNVLEEAAMDCWH